MNAAYAHEIGAAPPGEPGWDALATLLLLMAAALYFTGEAKARTRVGPVLRPWEMAAFTLGLLTIGIALVSPLDAWSDVLFAAHMSQHELLMVVAAPLIVFGRPWIATLWAMPPSWRPSVRRIIRQPTVLRVWHLATAPIFVVVLHAVTLWAWHVPALFDAALDDDRIHAVQHAMFFGTAWLFWWALVHGRYGRAGYGLAVLYVFFTATHAGILGAALALAGRTFYPVQADRAAEWGVDPLGDQHVAGLVMWVPGCAILLLLALALLAAWLGEGEKSASRSARLWPREEHA